MPAALAKLAEQLTCEPKFEGYSAATSGTKWRYQKLTIFLICGPAALAQVVEQLTSDPKFQGSNPAAIGKG
jgi:hypothetical protein